VSGQRGGAPDVVVVGAGAVGASAAYHLAAAGAGRILVLEREDSVAAGSTGRCAGGFRHQFSSAVNVALSQASVPLITGFSDEHGLPLDVWVDGYLFLCTDPAGWDRLRQAAGLQQRMGVGTLLLSAEEAGALVPGLRTDGIAGATFCAADGLADPAGLTQGYLTAARRLGAEVRLRTEVGALTTSGARVTGVRTSGGEVPAGTVVLAAGPWAAPLAATAGVALPVEPLARTIAVTAPFPGRPARRTLVVDAGRGLYFHREGAGVLLGMGAAGERTGFDYRPGADFLADELLPAAIGLYPALAGAALARTWTGFYEMTPDAHPVLGPAPGVEGLLLANGFSGHGFQHAPIVGRLLAEWVCEGGARSVDVSSLGLDRFASGRLLEERAVV
jgi:sarcosine oxidase subunit beta